MRRRRRLPPVTIVRPEATRSNMKSIDQISLTAPGRISGWRFDTGTSCAPAPDMQLLKAVRYSRDPLEVHTMWWCASNPAKVERSWRCMSPA
jgi:hypothetical protein